MTPDPAVEREGETMDGVELIGDCIRAGGHFWPADTPHDRPVTCTNCGFNPGWVGEPRNEETSLVAFAIDRGRVEQIEKGEPERYEADPEKVLREWVERQGTGTDSSVPPDTKRDCIEWWDDPDAATNNKRYYRHLGCDEGNAPWIVPRDDCPPPSWDTDECARCCMVFPLMARPVPPDPSAMPESRRAEYQRRIEDAAQMQADGDRAVQNWPLPVPPDTQEAKALDVKCPWCGANPGEACISQRDISQRTKHPHPDRIKRPAESGDDEVEEPMDYSPIGVAQQARIAELEAALSAARQERDEAIEKADRWIATASRLMTALTASRDREGRLEERAERAEEALVRLADHHHRTLTGSRLHDPEHQDWPECGCKSCEGVRLMLPDRAAEALFRYRQERALSPSKTPEGPDA